MVFHGSTQRKGIASGRAWLLALLLLLTFAAAARAQYNTTSDGAGGLVITGYTGSGGAIVIPGTIGGLSVTSIGATAFSSNTSLTSVTIPNSVTSIGLSAFYNCTSLTSVTIPNSVTSIGQSVFYSCTSLTSVTIGTGVTSIGQGAFALCSSLTSVTIPTSVTSIGQSAFYYCTSLTSFTIPNSVTSIGQGAFYQCTSLISVTIGTGVTSIGDDEFEFCSRLRNVTIPTGVTSIGQYAFEYCSSLTSETISNGVTSIGTAAFASCASLTSVTIPQSVTSIGADAFEACTSLASVTIPNGITSIGVATFAYCYSLTSVTIPASVTSIGTEAFYECTSLTSASFLGNAPTMGTLVFTSTAGGFTVIYYAGATGFTSPTWKDSSGDSWPAVTFTNSANFNTTSDGAGGLSIIYGYTGSGGAVFIPPTINGLPVTSIGDYAFEFVTNLSSVTIPTSVTSIGYEAFLACTNLTSVTIPNSVTSIGDYAFRQCTDLSSVTIPASVTSIGNGSFFDCTNLTSVTIPSSVTSIGNGAFQSCIKLTSAVFLGNAPTMGGNVFFNTAGSFTVSYYNGSGFTSPIWAADASDSYPAVNLGTNPAYFTTASDGAGGVIITGYTGSGSTVSIPSAIGGPVTSIGQGAFQNFNNLTSITIPASVTSIGSGVFQGCTSLTSITVSAQNSVFSSLNGVLFNENQTTLIQYPMGDAGSYAIPTSVTSIAQNAFAYCTGLTSVTIPAGITSIGLSAFQSCTSLTSAVFLGNAPTMGIGVFASAAGGFTVSYYQGATNFASPTWTDSSGDSYAAVNLGITSPANFTTTSDGAGGLVITGYTGSGGAVIIPGAIGGLTVTSIGQGAFQNSTTLVSITIPASVTSIGSGVFQGCTSLTSITVSAQNSALSSLNGVLFNENQTTLIQYPPGEAGSYTIPSSVTSIGNNAFYNCTGLTSVTIPASVTIIGLDAFEGTSLTSVTIPASVTSIGQGAFQNCYSLASAVFMGNAPTTGPGIFASTASDFTVSYELGATGFTSPTWTDSSGNSYPAFPPPSATLASPTTESPSSVQVSGFYNAEGSSPQLYFDYGTDQTMTTFSSMPATPSTATGYNTTPVNAVLTNLTQATLYYYRLRGTSTTGTVVSTVSFFQTQLLSVLQRHSPGTPPSFTGSLQVNLTPTTGGSNYTPGWRLVGEQNWRAPGTIVTGMAAGQYQIEFEPTSGYNQPAPEFQAIGSGETVVNQEYYANPSTSTGGLQVFLEPQGLAGAGWRLVGATNWNTTGATLSGLSPGPHEVECEPVPMSSGETIPATASLQVASNQTTPYYLSYDAITTPPGVPPVPLYFATIINAATPYLPYSFVGQIRSDTGTATGFVISDHVVATAGHVVFDDTTESYVTGLQWLFQRSAGTYEPVPVAPEGSLVFDGYATQREYELSHGGSPGVESTASQNLDVAALYFSNPAGNGGFSGYLASDSNTNEFLTSTTMNKMLVGYPVDGEPAVDTGAGAQGEMFATTPVTAAFTQVAGTDGSTNPNTKGNPFQVYTTNALYSVGGNSGGPLCVQFTDGNYYPAGVYLGGSGQTVVRSFDSNIIAMFTAAESDYSGANNEGGAVLTGTTLLADSLNLGSVTVNFSPASVASTAKWAFSQTDLGTAFANANGGSQGFLPVGDTYTLYFSSVAGFLAPASTPVTLTSNQGNTYLATYNYITNQPQNVTASANGNAAFTVILSGTPAAYQWQYSNGGSFANIQGATSATYQITNVTQANAGSYKVMVTGVAGDSVTSTAATLSVTGGSSQPPTFTQLEQGTGYLTTQQLGETMYTDPTAMPQKDGVSNLLKYVFDINPTRPMTASNLMALPELSMTGGQTPYLILTYQQYQNLNSAVSITVQSSTDMVNWTTSPAGSSITQMGTTANNDYLMQAKVPMTSSKQFIRLNVSGP